MLSPVHWATTRYQLGETILDSLGHNDELFRVRIKHKVARVIAMITHVNGNKMSKKGRKIMPVMTNMGKRARDHSNGDKDDKKER